ncbi:MAG: glycosyltransferase [Deltaproteobacteria bacterium]|nr:glycosyltransferase [Deltaproteobacteria bacterium]
MVGALALSLLCSLWLLSLLANLKMVRSLSRLGDLELLPPPAWPKLSIVVPACNEGETLGPALTTLRALDYPNLEIVLIDDRSTDRTGQIMDEAREVDSRLTVIHLDRLPEGWLGKVHALDVGTKASSGEIILFTDADVVFARDALTRAVSYFEHRGLDHLCVVPDITSRSFVASTMIATALRGIALSQRPWNTENPKKKETIGGGAFNMVRRSFFEGTPGFEWLRLEVADDIGLAHLMKQSGGKPSVLIAGGLVAVEWYSSVWGAIRGMEKNGFAQIARYSLARGLLLAALMVGVGSAPFLAMAHPFDWVRIAGVTALLVGAANGVLLSRWMKTPLLPQLLASPVGDFLLAFLIVRSTVLGVARGGLIWRGTVYPTAELRKGVRIKF